MRIQVIFGALALALACGAGAQAKPVINGMWLLDPASFGKGNSLPLSPAARKMLEEEEAAAERGEVIGEDQLQCLPAGMPMMMTNEFALSFLETPGRITILNEMSPLPRTVYLDKAHPADVIPNWNGHSVGRWEGDVLVIDTIGLSDRQQKGTLGFGGVRGTTTHIIERYSISADGKVLTGQFTYEDPKLLTRPAMATFTYNRLPEDAPVWEYACEPGGEGWADRFAGDKAAK